LEDAYIIFGLGSGSGPILNGTVCIFVVCAGVISGVEGFDEISTSDAVSLDDDNNCVVFSSDYVDVFSGVVVS
jgi:hypothetical protein